MTIPQNTELTSLWRYRHLIALGVLAAIVAVIYGQVWSFGYVNLDDGLYFAENPRVLGGLSLDTIRWAFTTFQASNWHPLTWLSLALDVQLFGPKPGMLHITNAVLHLINSFLLYLVFNRMTRRFWPSIIVAAFFAAHPAHVESVAWIAERKDVLSTMFWLLTMLAYVKFVESSKSIFSGRYFLILMLFALGLLAKPMLVTLPFVLLLCDYWPFERIRSFKFAGLKRPLFEKMPLLCLSALCSVMTVIAQGTGGVIVAIDALPLNTRIENAAASYGKYLLMLVCPIKLAVWYPYDMMLPTWQIAVSAGLLIAISAACVYLNKGGERKYLPFGWLWFLGTLVPVIGLVQVGQAALADRYTYISYIGLFVMIVWGLAELFEKLKLNAWAVRLTCAAAVVGLTAMGHVQASYWRSNEALYRRTLSVTKNNYLIEQNLCNDLLAQKRYDEAENYCKAALKSKPDYYEALNTLGTIAIARGRFDVAENYFLETVRFAPNYSLAHANLATAQVQLGKLDDAEINLDKAIEFGSGTVDPGVFLQVSNYLAIAYEKRNDFQKDAKILQRMAMLRPADVSIRLRLGFAQYKIGKLDDAQQQAELVLGREPGNPFALELNGLILLDHNDKENAAKQFEAALRIKPDLAGAKEKLKEIRGEK